MNSTLDEKNTRPPSERISPSLADAATPAAADSPMIRELASALIQEFGGANGGMLGSVVKSNRGARKASVCR